MAHRGVVASTSPRSDRLRRVSRYRCPRRRVFHPTLYEYTIRRDRPGVVPIAVYRLNFDKKAWSRKSTLPISYLALSSALASQLPPGVAMASQVTVIRTVITN